MPPARAAPGWGQGVAGSGGVLYLAFARFSWGVDKW
jgi:hypothetical protein